MDSLRGTGFKHKRKNQMTQNGTAMAVHNRQIVDKVAARVREFSDKGEIHFPEHYSPDNALKSAWLMIQDVKDMNKNSALAVCTQESVANALLDMVVQGLNPMKKQCYFIVYGKNLTMQRSVFGDIAIAKDHGAKDVVAQVVYKGDDVEYEINRGKITVTKHKQKLENVSFENIVAAYAILICEDGTEDTEMMTIDRIRQSWKKSKANPDRDGSTHREYADDMVLRTVTRKVCKRFINSSNDDNLVFRNSYNKSSAEAEAQAEIDENANKEVIGFAEVVEEDGNQVDTATGEVMQAEPETVGADPGF